MAVMKCVRITIIMKMELAAVATITMNTVPSAGMSTAMSRNTSTAMMIAVAAAKLILMKNMNMLPAAVKNMSTIITAAVVGKNIITATMFRGTRRTVSAKSAIRTKNTATCAAKALKTVPAACQTLTV